MKKVIFLGFAIVICAFISFHTFQRQQNQIEFNFIKYLNESKSEVRAFEQTDSFLTQAFSEYKSLKKMEILRAKQIGFNNSPTEKTFNNMLRAINMDNASEQDKILCKTVFRCGVIFGILEENSSDIKFPSKQQVVESLKGI